MFSQGNYNSQSGQGPQKPRPSSFLKHHSQAPPPPPPTTLPHNFQQGPLLPSPQVPPRPGQPGLPIYEHGPLAPHFGVRQVPPVVIPNLGQHYMHPPPTVHGTAPLPHMYSTAQHSYLPPGPPLPPPRSLPPAPSQGQTLYRAPIHQPPLQPSGVQGVQKIPPPPPSRPTSGFPTSAPSGSTSESTIGNPQMSSMVPMPPLPTSSPPLIPSSLPPPSFGNPPGSKLSDSPPPKPSEEIVQKIEELCQLIAKNGPSYEDMACEKEVENPLFKFLFGGEPGSDAAIAHEYFLWMKKKCKLEGIEHGTPTNHLTAAIEPHSPADSDMEMEDDITGLSDIDQAVNQPFQGPTQATQYSFVGHRDNSSVPLIDDKSSSRAAGAVECISSEKCPGKVMNGSSPFRLLQDYASNDSSENDEDLKDSIPEPVSQLVSASTEGLKLNRDGGLGLKLDAGSKSPGKTERGFSLHSSTGMPYRDPEFPSDSQNEVNEIIPPIVSRLSTKRIDNKRNQLSVDHAANAKGLPKEHASGGEWANAACSNKYEKGGEDKTAKSTSNTQKIDKFGRLVREGDSDSDSDDSHRARRRNKRGRSRSRSRSRSPIDRRRRRRRSPRRRRENGSRSRSRSPRNRRSRSRSPRIRRSVSRSPRNRRSRSRSPSFRYASEFRGSMRRDKGQMQACFDFLRGKCYRGASCHYLHHGSEKIDGSRHQRSKQQFLQLPPSSKNGDTHEDGKKISLRVDQGQETMDRNIQHDLHMSSSSILAAKSDAIVCNREDSVQNASVDFERINSGSVGEATAKVTETKVVQGRSENATTCIDENFPEDSVIQQSRPVLSHPVLEDANHPDQRADDSSISDSSPDKTSTTSPKRLRTNKVLPTSADSIPNPPQLPTFASSAQRSEDNNTLCVTQLSTDYNLKSQNVVSKAHSQSAPSENIPSYMLPDQSSRFSVPLNSSSVSLPPPPVLPAHVQTMNVGTAQPVPLQFQQSCLPPRSGFGSQMFSRPPYSTALSGNSQVGEFQHQSYPPVQKPHQPLLHAERVNPPGSKPSGQQFGTTGFFGENRLKQLPLQGLSASDSFTRGNNYPQPMPFSQESPTIKIQSLPGESLPPAESLKSSQIHPYLQQQQPSVNFYPSVSDSGYSLLGSVSSSSRYPTDHQEGNQSSHMPDFGVTSTAHFNPYASTFEKPLSSRFSSDVSRQEKDATYGIKHDHPFSLPHTSGAVGAQGAGSRQVTSSPTSASAIGKIVPASSRDQYDPLFDSIEPSSNSHKQSEHIQKYEPSGDSNIMLRPKGSNKASDMEENSSKKEIGSTASLDNEEFGETADAEVGDVENGSQSNPDALADTNMGEMEIDQIKSPGKSRKGKEPRSMKLFKACLADFVKEVLKPSWRQGNMSKETFKTVVKKTVDKVAAAMKNHQVPKSKEKINQYIDSSQKKLTKLVMGYMDKYAKG